MKSESDSKICPPELAVFIRDYHGVPSAARVLERNEYLLKETPPEKRIGYPIREYVSDSPSQHAV